MTINAAIDFRLLEAMGSVFLTTIEGELVGAVYGVTRLLKQGIETHPSLLNPLPSVGAQSSFREVDQLIAKLVDLTEELRQRNLVVARLEARMEKMEEPVPSAPAGTEESASTRSIPTIKVSEVRLHAIEDSLNSVELLAGGLGQQDEDLFKMNQRLSNLESLLQTLTHLPDPMGEHYRVIAGLDDRLSRLETQRLVDREGKTREIEPDRVF